MPIDGTCIEAAGQTDKCTTNDGKNACSSCGDGYFLHSGGCYSTAENKPGRTLCTAASGGVCTTATAGYFAIPNAPNTGESVVACNNEAGTSINSITYKGRANCEKCELPSDAAGSRTDKLARCTKCTESRYVKTDGSCAENASGCTADTEFAKEDPTNGNRCVPCGDKIDGITDCKTCSKPENALKCLTCATDTNKPNASGTKCVECTTEGCAKCSDEGVCVECSTGKLTPTGQCVDKCDNLGGYYADGNICKPCDSSCASCSTAGADKCLSCPAGKVLRYTDDSDLNQGGSCVDECKTNTGGCTDCGAVIEGSKYCSKCGDASQAPLNGNCAANTARTKFCTTAKDGACTQCANRYFLLDGGCYKTDRQPGSQVCTAATSNNGECTTCANKLSPVQGKCPSCDPSCKTCTKQSDPNACSACFSGYYFDATNKACKKCSETSGNIQGVPNCVSYAAPTGSGPVTCYVTQEPTVDPVDPSVNKSGLSTGAIAGISVAVIVVVGGLVGFLCWWFLCRGKA